MRAVALLALMAAPALGLELTMDSLFSSWKVQHGRSYASAEEYVFPSDSAIVPFAFSRVDLPRMHLCAHFST